MNDGEPKNPITEMDIATLGPPRPGIRRVTASERLAKLGITVGGQVIPAPDWLVKRMESLRHMPPPTLDEVKTQLEASAKSRRDVGRRRKK